MAERTTALLDLGDRPVTVLPNPVDPSEFTPRPGAVEPGTVLFLGSVCEKKGVRQLVEAMPAVVAAVPGARLMVAGRDVVDPATGARYREGLRAAVPPGVAGHVEFLGPVEHDRVAALLARGRGVRPPQPHGGDARGLARGAGRRQGPGGVAHRPRSRGGGRRPLRAAGRPLRSGRHRRRRGPGASPMPSCGPASRQGLAPGRSRRFAVDAAVADNLAHYESVAGPLVGWPAASPRPVVDHLVVVSHVVHHDDGGRIHAYTPYARELDRWASLVGRLTVAAPVRGRARRPPTTAPLQATNVQTGPAARGRRRPPRRQGGPAPAPAARWCWALDRALRGADAIQVRCPGNLGLLGAVLAPVRSRRVVAKYAGQWHGYAGRAGPVALAASGAAVALVPGAGAGLRPRRRRRTPRACPPSRRPSTMPPWPERGDASPPGGDRARPASASGCCSWAGCRRPSTSTR